ncbi:Uncharacterised protein [Bordetella pertussis]|nr:Uncharacterised protein [Bordetella pertussis]CFW43000.1 Uncharacterised protein [Bordetella pertussis]
MARCSKPAASLPRPCSTCTGWPMALTIAP